MENFVLRERLVDKNGWQHYVYQADECALHGTYVRATGIELYRNDFATTTQLQVAWMQWIPYPCRQAWKLATDWYYDFNWDSQAFPKFPK